MIVITVVDPDQGRHRFIRTCLERYVAGHEAGFPVRFYLASDVSNVMNGWRMFEENALIYREPFFLFLLVADVLGDHLEAESFLMLAQRRLGPALDKSVILSDEIEYPFVIVNEASVPVLDLRFPEARYELCDRVREFLQYANAQHEVVQRGSS